MSRVRVFVGCSLDGFIAGVGDDLSWLGDDPPEGEEGDEHGFDAFRRGEIRSCLTIH